MIDFGSIRRSWQLVGVQTPSYNFIKTKAYSKKYYESIESLPKLSENLKAKAKMAMLPELLKWAESVYDGAVRMTENTYSSVNGKYKMMGLMGVRSDMAALFQMAVELELWHDKNHNLFIAVLVSFFVTTQAAPATLC